MITMSREKDQCAITTSMTPTVTDIDYRGCSMLTFGKKIVGVTFWIDTHPATTSYNFLLHDNTHALKIKVQQCQLIICNFHYKHFSSWMQQIRLLFQTVFLLLVHFHVKMMRYVSTENVCLLYWRSLVKETFIFNFF